MRRALLLLVLATACAHYEVNPRIATPAVDPTHGYRFGTTNEGGRDDETFVVVTMSGGGTRAAALAYGVLQKLAATPIQNGKSDLLAAVDVVSSVSGGSFTSAYYALHGREGLPQLKKDFLDQNIQGALVKALFNPINWFRLLSPHYSRIDMAMEVYDKQIFKGATFADMPKSGRPFTILDATEMDVGSQFTFTQEQFDTICSDLDKVKVVKGVAASSAIPPALTPVTLRSYTANGGCGYQPGTWFQLASDDYLTNPRRYKFRSELAALLDPNRRYLHLSDGGVADNIGLRGSAHALVSTDTLQMNDTKPVFGYSVLRLINLRRVKRVVVIVVNAKTENVLKADLHEKVPGLIGMIGSAAGTPLANYSFDTIQMLNTQFELRERDTQIAAAGTPGFPQVKYYFIEVTFSAITDPAIRKQFNEMGTNFSLSPADVTKLIEIGPKLLDQSPKFQELVKDLQ
jgi:NTE family protein